MNNTRKLRWRGILTHCKQTGQGRSIPWHIWNECWMCHDRQQWRTLWRRVGSKLGK